MAQFSERLGFDLPDALARDGEVLADLLQGMLAAVRSQAEPHLYHFLFARSQGLQDLIGYLAQVGGYHRVGRVHYGLVFDEVAEMRILFLPDGSFQGDGLLCDLQNFTDLRDGDVHLPRDLFRARLAAEFLDQRAGGPDEFIDRLDHVNGDANSARLIRNRARYGLAYPPGRVGGKFISPPPLELIDGLHQADVALLDQVQELQAAVGVFLGDRYHEAKVRFDQFLLRYVGLSFPGHDRGHGPLHFERADVPALFEVHEPPLGFPEISLQLPLVLVPLLLFERALRFLDRGPRAARLVRAIAN